jgi:hypothetical protein
LDVLQWKVLVYFVAIRSIFPPFVIFYGHLVCFVVICYIFPFLVCCTEKNLATLVEIRPKLKQQQKKQNKLFRLLFQVITQPIVSSKICHFSFFFFFFFSFCCVFERLRHTIEILVMNSTYLEEVCMFALRLAFCGPGCLFSKIVLVLGLFQNKPKAQA